LNEPQRQAVSVIDGPLLVLAGAGSGKTRVITRRVAHLVERGIRPGSILAITFTNKAAGEMRQRVAALGTPPGAVVSTFHAFCARMLRDLADQAGVSRSFGIYDRADQLKLLKGVMAALNLKTGNFPPAKVHSMISKAKNALKTPEAYASEAHDFAAQTAAKVYKAYQQALASNNAMDFDDLLLRMATLMKDRPDVRVSLANRFRYLLIDEYQDTNHAQYVIAHGIAMEHENICVTGDPDQSIYAWRGADIGNILDFEKDYPDAVVIRLEENYRSTQPILAAASQLIGHNRLRKEKDLWTRREGGDKTVLAITDDQDAEARYVARRIGELRSAGRSCEEMAVFYRVNSLSRVLEQTFVRTGVPYRIARGVEFYNRKEIKDVLAYLRLLVNADDDVSCERIINTPARGIGPATVQRLGELAHRMGVSLLAGCSRVEQAGLSKGAESKVRQFARLMSRLGADLDRSVRQIVEDVVRLTGLDRSIGDGDDSEDARANIGEFITTAEEFDEDAPPDAASLNDFINQVSLASDVDHLSDGGGAVTLMTLHAAKGLEFPVVFIVGCEDGVLPLWRDDAAESWSGAYRKQMEEERRLAFVGMTRAKDELTLTCARRRMIRGKTSPQVRSPFIEEIGPDNLDVRDLTSPDLPPGGHYCRSEAPSGGFYADVEDRAIIEAGGREVEFPPEYEHMRPGSMIRHPKFGKGKIVSLSQPWPETRAVVQFAACGRKTLVLAMAKVELLGIE
jgi:DNA helicase-2/ATP-dependent DNA helicase PcrA